MRFKGRKRYLTVFAALFLIVLLMAFLGQLLSPIILALYCVMSIITFIVYALDKSKAKRNAWRIEEATLHSLAFAGGWPGAIFGQEFLRHKTVKGRFRVIFYFTMIGNILLLALLLSGYANTVVTVLQS